MALGSFMGAFAGGASVNIVIRAVDQFSGTLDSASRKLTTFQGVASLTTKSASFAFKALTTAVVGTGVAFTTAAVASLKMAADFEQTTIAIKGMVGDLQASKKFLSDLTDFAAKTPFELTGLTNASKQLLGYQIPLQEVL